MLNVTIEKNHPDRKVKVNLAAAYQAFALHHMDDHIYTHLSARLSSNKIAFIPFGLLYEEVTASKLEEFDLHELPEHVNNPGFLIHSEIYKARPDINYVFHFHTPAITAVSVDKRGLLPVTQWAMFFQNQIAYHAYDAITTQAHDHAKMTYDLGSKNILMMHNHGATVCGQTIEETFFNSLYLQKACEAQCLFANVDDKNIIFPSQEICNQTYETHQKTENPYGFQTFQAILRKLDRLGISYKD